MGTRDDTRNGSIDGSKNGPYAPKTGVKDDEFLLKLWGMLITQYGKLQQGLAHRNAMFADILPSSEGMLRAGGGLNTNLDGSTIDIPSNMVGR